MSPLPADLPNPSPALEQQAEQLNAKIEKTQEEVNFLSTYMDREYSIKSIQISTLVRQLQQDKDSQQVGDPLPLPHQTVWESGLVANTLLLDPRMSWMTSVRCAERSWNPCLTKFRRRRKKF